ncbi:MAG: hypothetical protein D3915_13300 [Candidatus Electrothrix sp. AU1_5]|nr:hypothetical protein [Candidatus Electrothrix gigas]
MKKISFFILIIIISFVFSVGYSEGDMLIDGVWNVYLHKIDALLSKEKSLEKIAEIHISSGRYKVIAEEDSGTLTPSYFSNNRVGDVMLKESLNGGKIIGKVFFDEDSFRLVVMRSNDSGVLFFSPYESVLYCPWYIEKSKEINGVRVD